MLLGRGDCLAVIGRHGAQALEILVAQRWRQHKLLWVGVVVRSPMAGELLGRREVEGGHAGIVAPRCEP